MTIQSIASGLRGTYSRKEATWLSEKGEAVKVFKVMTQKDRAFGGKFNPEKIEEALNAMGKEGWEIDGVTSAEFPSITGGRQELVIFLSKEV
jgi:hypothetical protein